MDHSQEMRRCLEECDVQSIQLLWTHISPNMPQPRSDYQTLVQIHIARTQAEWLKFNKRAYSHAWLRERRLPSMMPDHLRPSAEQICPPQLEGVGISVGAKHRSKDQAENKSLAVATRKVMEDVVMDHYSSDLIKKPDPAVVKRDMLRERDSFLSHVVEVAMSGWRKRHSS